MGSLKKEKVLDLLNCNKKTLEEKEICKLDAKYYRNTARGGGAVIISDDEEMLLVDPFFVNYDEHVKQFISGKRTTFVRHSSKVENNE